MDRVGRIVESMIHGTMVGDPRLVAQTEYRVDLVDGWGIAEGASVLEIGCGQGDMTAVLADAVGATGRVVAIDNADPASGSPVTYADAADHLGASPVGSRVDMRYGVDVRSADFGTDEFDHVVLSHSSWFFARVGDLHEVLRHVGPWSRSLCFAEWDLTPSTLDQVPHLLAVLVQGQVRAAGGTGPGNVHSPYARDELLAALPGLGWRVAGVREADTSALQDADWEIHECLALVGDDGRLAAVPDPLRHLARNQAATLRSLARDRGNIPLPAYALLADRA